MQKNPQIPQEDKALQAFKLLKRGCIKWDKVLFLFIYRLWDSINRNWVQIDACTWPIICSCTSVWDVKMADKHCRSLALNTHTHFHIRSFQKGPQNRCLQNMAFWLFLPLCSLWVSTDCLRVVCLGSDIPGLSWHLEQVGSSTGKESSGHHLILW